MNTFSAGMDFKIIGKDKYTKARAGQITTEHGKIQTPAFMPVGTLGAVKSVHFNELENDTKAQIILGNTYHLYLRPGIETIKAAKSIHDFTGWKKPFLTDSGGYQVYSLANTRKLTEKGVIFQSHIDGSEHEFTPENVVDIQRTVGADIIMAFDECTPYPCDYEYAKKSMYLTHKWLDRCIERFNNTKQDCIHSQSIFPIVQGSVYKDLRIESAEEIASKNAKGNAIGGLSVGEPVDIMYNMTSIVCDILPENKPRYLMGVGMPENILESVARGIDMFDCVIPTRNARHGMIFTRKGVINIKNEKWKNDFNPLDEEGDSFVDSQYSRAFLRHLIISNETLGAMIASLHNLRFYVKLMEDIRKNIIDGTFNNWKNKIIKEVTRRI